MKKRALLPAILVALVCHITSAQDRALEFASEQEARHMVNLIVDVVGLKPNFNVKVGNVSNAAAVISEGKRYILYNPVFIRQIRDAVRTDWGGMSILAHEVGHHLNGHTLLGSGSEPVVELEADEFAGFVLRRLGATLAQSQAAMVLISDESESMTHPSRSRRLASIETGWNRANFQIASTSNPNVPIPGKETNPGERPSTEDKEEVVVSRYSFPKQYISYDVQLDGLPSEELHVTIQNNLIRVTEDGYEVVGALIQSGRNYYLSFSSDFNLRVTLEGYILDDQGNKIGQLYKSA